MALLESVVGGLLVNLISAASSRGFGAFLPAHRQSLKLRRILEAKDITTDPTIAQAIRDITKVLGNDLGQYTDDIKRLLDEVAHSQLATALIIAVQTSEKNVTAIESEFIARYGARITGIGIAPEAFFRAFAEAVNSIMASKFVDPQLGLLVSEKSTELTTRLDSIIEILRESRTSALPYQRYSELSGKICKHLANTYKTIGVETSRGQTRVNISTHFIKSRLRYMSPDDFYTDLVVTNDSDRDAISFSAFASSFHRAVVLGNPGGGKSTLCQYLCFDVAQRYQAYEKHPDRDDHDLSLVKVPITVVLRRFERYHNDTNKSVIDFIAEELSSIISEDPAVLVQWLRQSLADGRCLVLFDGLDEIMEVAARRRFVKMVEAFSDLWTAIPILATTRKVGYTKAPLSDEFAPYELAPFNSAEVLAYSTKLIGVEKTLKRDRADEFARQFCAQTDKNASDLRRNPLMLGLMVWLFCVQGEVPSHRAEIYKQCSDLMFERWDKNRGIRASIPDDFDLTALFCFLASNIFGSAKLEDGVDADWLEQTLYQFFRRWYEENAKAKQAAKLMQEFVTGRAWVMTDVGAGVYRFTHRTFLEYFFSRHILGECDTAKSLIARLRSKILASQWDVINHLCIQGFCYKDLRRSDQIADLFESMIESVTGEKLENATNFVARTLEYLALSESKTRKIAAKVVKAAFEIEAVGLRIRALSAIDLCLAVHESRRNIVVEEINREIRRIAKSKSPSDEPKIDNLLVFLSQTNEQFLVYVSIPTLGRRIRSEIAREFVDRIEEYGRSSIRRAEMAVNAAPSTFSALYRIFGDSLILQSSFHRLHGLAMPLLVEALFSRRNGFVEGGERSELLKEIADEFVQRVSDGKLPLAAHSSVVAGVKTHSASIVRQFAGRIIPPKPSFEIALAWILFRELEYLAAHPEQHQMPTVGRSRSIKKVIREAATPNKVAKIFDSWVRGEISLVSLAT